MADRAASVITKGREVVIQGRLAVNNFTTTSENGDKIQVSKPAIRLLSFHLCGKKPENQASEADKEPTSVKRSRGVGTSLEPLAFAEPHGFLPLSPQCPHRAGVFSCARPPSQNPPCRFPATGSPEQFTSFAFRPCDVW